MARYLFKPVVIEAVRWYKDGDHPAVRRAASGKSSSALMRCRQCRQTMVTHGKVRVAGRDVTVCPGDYIVSKDGQSQPVGAKEFEAMTVPVDRIATETAPANTLEENGEAGGQ